MGKIVRSFFFVSLIFLQVPSGRILAQEKVEDGKTGIVQSRIVLTVSESKRLIGKAVAQMSIVKKALNKGMVIIAKGTTNTYVAEEILGQTIEKGAYVIGRVYPTKGGKKLKPSRKLPEIVLINGKVAKGLSLKDAVEKLKPGDVVIKGANALDYKNKTAGVYIGGSNGGTTGTFMPYVVARKAYLVIPVGLEKLVAENVVDLSLKMREPVVSIDWMPSMFLLTGEIVTEIEALKILTGISAFQVGAGGIGGAEGAVHLLLRGSKEQVKRSLELVKDIQGEPPFVE